MKQLTWLIVALAGVPFCGPVTAQEHGSREIRGVIKPAPEKPSAGQIGAQGTSPARESASGSQIEDFCASADRDAQGAVNKLSSTQDGRVIGKGRLHFHTAPKMRCRSRHRFIIPGDSVVAHRRVGEWLLIDYVSRDGVKHSAWVDAARIDFIKPGARP